MLRQLKTLRNQLLKIEFASLYIEDLAALHTRKMMMMLRMRYLIQHNSTRHINTDQLFFADECLQISVNGSNTKPRTFLLSALKDFLNRKRSPRLLQSGKNRLALLRISFHKGNFYTPDPICRC